MQELIISIMDRYAYLETLFAVECLEKLLDHKVFRLLGFKKENVNTLEITKAFSLVTRMKYG